MHKTKINIYTEQIRTDVIDLRPQYKGSDFSVEKTLLCYNKL